MVLFQNVKQTETFACATDNTQNACNMQLLIADHERQCRDPEKKKFSFELTITYHWIYLFIYFVRAMKSCNFLKSIIKGLAL